MSENPHGKITQLEARAIASGAVHHQNPSAGFVILDDKTVDRDFGWVFSYVPQRYLETRDPGDLLPGYGPLVVLRENGAIVFLPTSVAPARAIEEFERHWRSQHGR